MYMFLKKNSYIVTLVTKYLFKYTHMKSFRLCTVPVEF